MRLASAELEIFGLRVEELRKQQASEEADRLVMRLLSVYAADFVIADLPSNWWAPLPRGWQAGLAEAPRWFVGFPPKDLRGPVAVSLDMLRRMAG